MTRTNSFGTWSRSDEVDLRDVGLALPLGARPGRVVDLLERHGRLVRRLRQLAQADVLHEDLDLVSDGFVTKISMVRLWSFWAIVASARAGSRKNSESGYSRWTVDRMRLKCFTTNCVRK